MQDLSFIRGRWRVLPAPDISLLRSSHAEPAAAAKHLVLGVNPDPPQTLHGVYPELAEGFGLTFERPWVGVAVRVDPTLALV